MFLVIDLFVLPIQYVLILAFSRAVFHANVALSIVTPSTKWSSSFLKKILVFQKTCSKNKVLKTFKISVIITFKNVDLLNGGLFQKSLVSLFKRTQGLFVEFEIKSLQRSLFRCCNILKDKN